MPCYASCYTHPKMNPASKSLWSHIGICSRHDLKPEFYFGTGISGIFGIKRVNDAVVNPFKKRIAPPEGGAQ